MIGNELGKHLRYKLKVKGERDGSADGWQWHLSNKEPKFLLAHKARESEKCKNKEMKKIPYVCVILMNLEDTVLVIWCQCCQQ